MGAPVRPCLSDEAMGGRVMVVPDELYTYIRRVDNGCFLGSGRAGRWRSSTSSSSSWRWGNSKHIVQQLEANRGGEVVAREVVARRVKS